MINPHFESEIIEIETKLMIDEEGFNHLLDLVNNKRERSYNQIYFDTNNAILYQLGGTFRIEISPDIDTVDVTLKLPATKSADEIESQKSWEFTDSFSISWLTNTDKIDVDTQLSPKMIHELKILGINSLYRLGEISKTRYDAEIPTDGHIEIDKVIMPGNITIYEVEIENPDASERERISRWIREQIPAARASKMNKYQRFIRALELQAMTQKAINHKKRYFEV